MANRIKSISKYSGTAWGTETPIGADAANVDLATSYTTVTESTATSGATAEAAIGKIHTDTTNLKKAGHGNGTVTNYDSTSGETSKVLTTDCVVAASDDTATAWSKFNRFRRRVSNKFADYFLTSNLVKSSTGVTTTGADTTVYTTKAINNYLANVVGYTSSTAPTAGTIASQLSTLNDKTIESTITDTGAFNGFTTIGALNWLYEHSNVTSSSQNVTWIFGTLFFRRRGPVVTVAHWPTSVDASGIYDYSYSNTIPAAYCPIEDVRVFADDWAHGGNYALVQFITDGTMKVRTQVTNSGVQLHFSATYLVDSTK